MENYNVWAKLNPSVQAEIVDRLIGGERPYDIASDYGLYPPSLERKWRQIKSDIRSSSFEDTNEQTELNTERITSSIEEPKIVNQELKRYKFKGITAKLFGAKDSLPMERILKVDTKKPLTILAYSDTHFGEEDKAACEAFLRVAANVKHDLIVHCGDALEMYGLSQYGKDPRKMFTQTLKEELQSWQLFSNKLEECSQVPKFMVFGNHMERYYKWLAQNPAVFYVDEMELDYLLKLEEYNYLPSVNSIYFDLDNDQEDYPDPHLVIHHGTTSRKHSGSSSRVESENFGYTSSISGHVHRLSSAYKRTHRGQIVYAEAGTLRNLTPGYINFPDWQHGCLLIEYDFAAKYISINPILILNGKAYLNGIKI